MNKKQEQARKLSSLWAKFAEHPDSYFKKYDCTLISAKKEWLHVECSPTILSNLSNWRVAIPKQEPLVRWCIVRKDITESESMACFTSNHAADKQFTNTLKVNQKLYRIVKMVEAVEHKVINIGDKFRDKVRSDLIKNKVIADTCQKADCSFYNTYPQVNCSTCHNYDHYQSIQECNYPDCNCPFDMDLDGKCLVGLLQK